MLGSSNQLDIHIGTWDVSVLSPLQCASAIPFCELVFHDLKGFEICSIFFQSLCHNLDFFTTVCSLNSQIPHYASTTNEATLI